MRPRVILAARWHGTVQPGCLVVDVVRRCIHAPGHSLFNQSGKRASARFAVLAILLLRSPSVVSMREIVEYAYGERPDGGPEGADTAIRTTMWAIRSNALDWVLGGRVVTLGNSLGYVFEFEPYSERAA